MKEKWVLARSTHLGAIGQSVSSGAVLEYDDENPNKLIVEGREYDSAKDLVGLKMLNQRNPQSPFMVPWTEDAEADARADAVPLQLPGPPHERHSMPIVQSDEDSIQTIDISGTRNRKIGQAREEEGMQVIRGDEDVDSRLARLEQEEGHGQMEVVRDDQLGNDLGNPSRNTGQVTFRDEDEVNRLRDEAREKAARYGQEGASEPVHESRAPSGGEASDSASAETPEVDVPPAEPGEIVRPVGSLYDDMEVPQG